MARRKSVTVEQAVEESQVVGTEAAPIVPDQVLTASEVQAAKRDDGLEEIQVDALQGYRPVWSINGQGERFVIGNVRYRDYDGKTFRGGMFIPERRPERPFPLGQASSKFGFVPHADVIEPLLDGGFEIVPNKLHESRYGSEIFATLYHKDRAFEDLIKWDEAYFPNPSAMPLYLAVAVRSSLSVGRGIQLTIGFFRQVCINGLITKWLGLGVINMNHRSFKVDKVRGFVEGALKDNALSPYNLRAASPKALAWPAEQMNRLFTAPAEDKGKLLAELPKIARLPLQGLDQQLPGWAKPALVEQMRAMQGAEQFSTLDLLNAVTNTGHSAPKGGQLLEKRLDPIMRDLVDVVELGALKAGVQALS